MTSWPSRASWLARPAPTRPQPTMMVRIDQDLSVAVSCLAVRDGLTDDEDATGRVLEDVRDGLADGEVAPEADPVGQAQDDGVGLQRDGLVHERGAHVARLEQLGLELDALPLGHDLGAVEDARARLALPSERIVETVAPVDLDDVDGPRACSGRLVRACSRSR